MWKDLQSSPVRGRSSQCIGRDPGGFPYFKEESGVGVGVASCGPVVSETEWLINTVKAGWARGFGVRKGVKKLDLKKGGRENRFAPSSKTPHEGIAHNHICIFINIFLWECSSCKEVTQLKLHKIETYLSHQSCCYQARTIKQNGVPTWSHYLTLTSVLFF